MSNAQRFGNDEEEGQAGSGGFRARPVNLSGGDSRMISLSGNDPRMINLSGGDEQMINLSGGGPQMIDLTGANGPGMIQLRADGGPVRKGRPYVVGERGPELVVPREGRGRKNAGGKKDAAKGVKRGGAAKGRKAGLDCVPGTKEKKSAWFARLARGGSRGGTE